MKRPRRARSAVTGRFVTLAYALLHPRETVVELVRRKSGRDEGGR